MANPVVWFDMPAINLERAIQFYNKVLDLHMKAEEMGGVRLGLFPGVEGQSSGCLVAANELPAQTAQGPLVYFSANGRLEAALEEVEKQGGKILEPRHAIGEWGFHAIVQDSEGNRIALHSA